MFFPFSVWHPHTTQRIRKPNRRPSLSCYPHKSERFSPCSHPYSFPSISVRCSPCIYLGRGAPPPFPVLQLPDSPAFATLISPLPFIHLGYNAFKSIPPFHSLSHLVTTNFFPSLSVQLLYYDPHFSPLFHHSNHCHFSLAPTKSLQALTLKQ